MKKVNKEVQEQIELYRKTGKSYLDPTDLDFDFSNCDEKPKKESESSANKKKNTKH